MSILAHGAQRSLTIVGIVMFGVALATLMVIGSALPARAEAPFAVTEQVTDRAGALDEAQRAELISAVTDLADKTGIKAYVVYVSTVDGISIEQWATETGQLSNLRGERPILYAMTIGEDKSQLVGVAHSVDFPLSDEALGSIINDASVPAMQESNWASAGINTINLMKERALAQGATIPPEPEDTPSSTNTTTHVTESPEVGLTSPASGISQSAWYVLMGIGVLILAAVVLAVVMTRRRTVAAERKGRPGPVQGTSDAATIEGAQFAPPAPIDPPPSPMDMVVQRTDSAPRRPESPETPARAFDSPPKRVSVSEAGSQSSTQAIPEIKRIAEPQVQGTDPDRQSVRNRWVQPTPDSEVAIGSENLTETISRDELEHFTELYNEAAKGAEGQTEENLDDHRAADESPARPLDPLDPEWTAMDSQATTILDRVATDSYESAREEVASDTDISLQPFVLDRIPVPLVETVDDHGLLPKVAEQNRPPIKTTAASAPVTFDDHPAPIDDVRRRIDAISTAPLELARPSTRQLPTLTIALNDNADDQGVVSKTVKEASEQDGPGEVPEEISGRVRPVAELPVTEDDIFDVAPEFRYPQDRYTTGGS